MDGKQVVLILERDLSLFKRIRNPIHAEMRHVRIVHTASLEEFLQLVDAIDPNLVILDHDFPETEDPRLLKALQEKLRTRSTLMLMDTPKGETIRRMMGPAAIDFVSKTPDALDNLSQRLLDLLKGVTKISSESHSEEDYRDLFENAYECVFRLDEAGRIGLINYAATRLTGFSRDELTGKHWTAFFDRSEVIEIKRRMERAGRQEVIPNMQTWIMSRSGEKVAIEMSVNPIVKGDKLLGYQGIMNRPPARLEDDDAANKEHYEELIEKNRYLEELNNLKTQFLSTVSHELRTPMSAILGYAELLLEQLYGSVNEAQGNALKNIIDSGNHLLKLINELLDFARIQNGKFQLYRESYPALDIIETAIATIKPSIGEKKLKFIHDIESDLPILFIDAQKIYQVLLNLLSNAVKFTDKGRVELKVYRREDALEFAIRDTGIGIAAHDIEKIFEDFAQVDGSISRSYGGAGLGLSLAKHLVKLHEGEIWVESIPEKGSSFYFSLPIDQTIASDTESVSRFSDEAAEKIVR